jgi:hypothetical protein
VKLNRTGKVVTGVYALLLAGTVVQVPRIEVYSLHGRPKSVAVGYSLLWNPLEAPKGHGVVLDVDRWSIEAEALTAAWLAVLLAFGRRPPFARSLSGVVEVADISQVNANPRGDYWRGSEVVHFQEVTPLGRLVTLAYASAVMQMPLFPRWEEIVPIPGGKWDTRPVGYAPLWQPPMEPGLSIRIDLAAAGGKLVWTTIGAVLIVARLGLKNVWCYRPKDSEAEWRLQESGP